MISIRTIGLQRAATSTIRSSFFKYSTIPIIKQSHAQEEQILIKQRINRPMSPHLTIYEPQITAILSAFHRITGVALGGAFYALTLSYAATSLLNYNFDSSLLISLFAELPVYAKVALKSIVAYPFFFHSFNGIRHLIWDFGYFVNIPGVYKTGYAVLALTGLVGSAFAFLY